MGQLSRYDSQGAPQGALFLFGGAMGDFITEQDLEAIFDAEDVDGMGFVPDDADPFPMPRALWAKAHAEKCSKRRARKGGVAGWRNGLTPTP